MIVNTIDNGGLSHTAIYLIIGLHAHTLIDHYPSMRCVSVNSITAHGAIVQRICRRRLGVMAVVEIVSRSFESIVSCAC